MAGNYPRGGCPESRCPDIDYKVIDLSHHGTLFISTLLTNMVNIIKLDSKYQN